MKALLTRFLVFICLAILLGCDKVPPESLRIATFNAYLLSPPFRCLNATLPDCIANNESKSEGWAEDLANRILADKDLLDVIVLNEVWDEDARSILVHKLSADYPIQVRKISRQLVDLDLSGVAAPIRPRLFGEDSGLMLFAKPEFVVVPLPDQTQQWKGDDLTAILDALDATTQEVAFQYYRNCSMDDCFAAKGVALVRLRHKRGAVTYNIAFTHMQADPDGKPEKWAEVRAKQFEEIRQFILRIFPNLGARLVSGETLLLLGDLNVPFLKKDYEWKKLFNNPSSFFSSSLVESWVTTNDPLDRTPTNLGDEERLDYILHGPSLIPGPMNPFMIAAAGRRHCVQHLTVPKSFVQHASDHSMVHADINLGWWFCNPQMAMRFNSDIGLDVVAPPPGATDAIQIRNRGSIQWFYVEDREVATYSIGTDRSSDLSVSIFLPTNMTNPIARYNLTEGTGLPPRGDHHGKFKTDLYSIQGPFYIRVAGKDRSKTGKYQLAVRKHDCATRETACVLRPANTHLAKLSAEGAINPQREAWFRFDVIGTPTMGGGQQINLVAQVGIEGAVTGELVGYSDPGGATVVETFNPVLSEHHWSGPASSGASGYVRIVQRRPAATEQQVSAMMDTSLRILQIDSLVCKDETNPEIGSDDIYTWFAIDGVQRRAPLSGTRQFDCDDSKDSRQWGDVLGLPVIAFTNEVSVRLYEQDMDPDDISSTQKLRIPASGVNALERQSVKWLDFDEGMYELWYETRRWENAPVADP